MNKKITSFLSVDEFGKNVLILFSGVGINLILSVTLTPIITRLYDTESYGVFSIFLSIINTISLLSLLTFNQAIVIPESNEESSRIIQICILLSYIGTALSFIIVFSIRILPVNQINLFPFYYLLAIPIGVFLNTFRQILEGLNVREKRFKLNTRSNISRAFFTKGTSIVVAKMGYMSPFGLLLGVVFGSLTSVLFLLGKGFLRIRFLIKYKELKNLKSTFLKYISYPKYILPGVLLNKFSSDIPLYLATIYLGAAMAGSFALANSMMNLPVGLISASIVPAFLQRSNELAKKEPQELSNFVEKIFFKLLFVGSIPIIVIIYWGENLFEIFFGDSWSQAGKIAGYLSLYVLFKVISSPISCLYRVFEKEKTEFRFNIFIFSIRLISIIGGLLWFKDEKAFLVFSIGSMIAYFMNTLWILKISNLNWTIILLKTSGYFLLVFAIVGLIKMTF